MFVGQHDVQLYMHVSIIACSDVVLIVISNTK